MSTNGLTPGQRWWRSLTHDEREAYLRKRIRNLEITVRTLKEMLAAGPPVIPVVRPPTRSWRDKSQEERWLEDHLNEEEQTGH